MVHTLCGVPFFVLAGWCAIMQAAGERMVSLSVQQQNFNVTHAVTTAATPATAVLPQNHTSESRHGPTVSCNVSVTCAYGDTVIAVYVRPERPSSGVASSSGFEGVPAGDVYVVESAAPIANWVRGFTDFVVTTDRRGQQVLDRCNTSGSFVVRGLDDWADDGDGVAYDVSVDVVVRDGNSSTTVTPVRLQLFNEDNDEAGVVLYPRSGSNDTASSGTTVLYETEAVPLLLSMHLTSQPRHPTLFAVSTSCPERLTASPNVVVITDQSWQVDQWLTVRPIDDEYFSTAPTPCNVSVYSVFSQDDDYFCGVDGVALNTKGCSTSGGGNTTLVAEYSVTVIDDDKNDIRHNECLPGQYGHFNTCFPCPAGRYADATGNKSGCAFCPPGSYGVLSGSLFMGIERNPWITPGDYDDPASLQTDPACLPCPVGTYSDRWGATACDPCDADDDQEDGCATVGTPRPRLYNTREWSRHKVTQLWSYPKGSNDEIIGKVEEGGVMLAALVTGAIVVFVVGMRNCASRRQWLHIKLRLIAFDEFVRSLLTTEYSVASAVVDGAMELPHRAGDHSVLSAVTLLSIFAFATCISVSMLTTYAVYGQVAIVSSAPPSNSITVDDYVTAIDLHTEFWNFPACSVTGGLHPSIRGARIVAEGLKDKHTTSETSCSDEDDGVLIVDVQIDDTTFSRPGGSLRIVVEPDCEAVCDTASSSGTKECRNCSMVMASGIVWSVTLSPVHPSDINTVHGHFVPANSSDMGGSVFRGGDHSVVGLNLRTTKYENEITEKTRLAYRAQWDFTHIGGHAVHETACAWSSQESNDCSPTWTALSDFDQMSSSAGHNNFVGDFITAPSFVSSSNRLLLEYQFAVTADMLTSVVVQSAEPLSSRLATVIGAIGFYIGLLLFVRQIFAYCWYGKRERQALAEQRKARQMQHLARHSARVSPFLSPGDDPSHDEGDELSAVKGNVEDGQTRFRFPRGALRCTAHSSGSRSTGEGDEAKDGNRVDSGDSSDDNNSGKTVDERHVELVSTAAPPFSDHRSSSSRPTLDLGDLENSRSPNVDKPWKDDSALPTTPTETLLGRERQQVLPLGKMLKMSLSLGDSGGEQREPGAEKADEYSSLL